MNPLPVRALYVDDEPSLLDVTKTFLEIEGDIQMDVLPSGPQALEVLKGKDYDVIVSDYQMPDMDGIRLLNTLRSEGNTTPFILFTGKGREEVAIEALNSGADFYLQKGGNPSVQFGELRNIIMKLSQKNWAEKALQESESKYRELVESANSLIMRIDSDGRIRYMNEFALDFFGFRSEDLLGRLMVGSILPKVDDFGMDMSLMASNVLANPQDFGSVISQNVKRTGEKVWVAWTNKAIRNAMGEVKGILSVGTDMTTLHRTEERLKSSVSLLKATLESTTDGIMVVDLERRVTAYNKQLMDMWGIPSLAMNDHDPEVITTILGCMKDPSAYRAKAAELSNNPGISHHTVIELADDRAIEVTTQPQITDGKVTGRVWNFRDITEAKTAERRLRDSEYLLQQTQSAAHIGGYRIDLVNGRSEWTDEAFRICGIDPAIQRENKEDYLKLVAPQDRDLVNRAWWEQTDRQADQDFIYRLLTPDGSLKYIHNRGRLELDEKGNVIAIFGTIMDVTPLKEAEAKLMASRTLLEEAQKLAHTGSFRYNLRSGRTEYSKEMGEIVGLDPSTDTILELMAAVHPEDRERLDAMFKHLIEVPEDFHIQYRVVTPGGLRRLDSIGRFEAGEDGKPLYVVGAVSDITDKHRAEEERLRSESKFRDLFDTANDLMIIMDQGGRILEANRAACAWLSYSREEMLSMTVSSLIEPSLRSHCSQEFIRIMEGGGCLQESRYVSKEGRVIPVEVNCRKIEMEGRPAFMCIARDITERKEAERRLTASERLLAEAERTSHIGSYRLDRGTGKVQCSEELMRLMGWDPAEGAPSLEQMIELVHPEEREEVRAMTEMATAQGREFDLEYQLMLRDGSIRYVHHRAKPVVGASGAPEGVLGTIMDITDRMRAERSAELANLKLALLTDITRHDVQNKVTALTGYLQLIEMRTEEQRQRELIAKARQAAQNIARQMAFSKEYQTLGQNEARWLNLEKACEDGLADLDLGAIQLIIDLSGFEVFADPMLEKVFYNLVENSVRYGRTASRVELTARRTDPGLLIVCHDNGVGIPDEDKHRLFNWEYRDRRGHGLHLIKEVLQLSGMSIHEAGKAGEGARFIILVPSGRYRTTDARGPAAEERARVSG